MKTRKLQNSKFIRQETTQPYTHRIAVRRKFEDAWWRRSHVHCAGAADTPCRHANRTPTWTSDLHRRYFAWNWTIPVVMLATVVGTSATLLSNSCRSANF